MVITIWLTYYGINGHILSENSYRSIFYKNFRQISKTSTLSILIFNISEYLGSDLKYFSPRERHVRFTLIFSLIMFELTFIKLILTQGRLLAGCLCRYQPIYIFIEYSNDMSHNYIFHETMKTHQIYNIHKLFTRVSIWFLGYALFLFRFDENEKAPKIEKWILVIKWNLFLSAIDWWR